MYPLSYLMLMNGFKNGAWFEPSTEKQIENMITLLSIKPGERIVDLGAGDGRIVVALARHGAQAFGIEKDRKLVEKANQAIAEAQLSSKATMIQANFWDVDLSSYDKVTIYQFRTVMGRLEEKLGRELPHQSTIVSNTWQFPHWQPVKNLDEIYLYLTP